MNKKYVLGFAFDRNKELLVLIEKQKPEWQRGLLNGVGGKVDPEDESILHAMVREFKEETGVDTKEQMSDPLYGWHHFATMLFKDDIMGGSAEVYCFRMFSNLVFKCETKEIEQIKFINLMDNDLSLKMINNLKVLIPMAMDDDFTYCELNLK
jgi:8-oxo-dGTP diphosphatase